jgi:hypothetical protein
LHITPEENEKLTTVITEQEV